MGVMADVKEEVIRMVRAMPDNATVDDVMAELYFKMQVDAGLRELNEGKGIPHGEVERQMSKWLGR